MKNWLQALLAVTLFLAKAAASEVELVQIIEEFSRLLVLTR